MGQIRIKLKSRAQVRPEGDGRTALSAVTDVRHTATTADIAAEIEQASSLTAGDVRAALSALGEALRRHLADGHSVHLDGLGTFGISLSCTAAEGGRPRCADVSMRRITFRAERALARRVREECSFVSDGGLPLPQRRRTREEIVEMMRAYLREKGRRDFVMAELAAMGLRPTTYARDVREMAAGGVLGCRMVGQTGLYWLLV